MILTLINSLDTFAYASSLVPIVSEDIGAIDGAMKVGYNWKKGPFEMMDSIGLEWLVEQMTLAEIEIPPFLALAAKNGSFYGIDGGEIFSWTQNAIAEAWQAAP